jgi:hypothetical protein
MSDTTAGGETPIEPVPSVPPAPEAPAELEAVPPQATAADGLAPPPDAADVDAEAAAPSTDASAVPAAERALPFDVEHLGVLRRAVLDHLVDTDEPQSVAQILGAMPSGTTRGSAESAIRREFDAGRIERVAPGTYRLAPPRPSESPKRPSPPPPSTPEDEQVWLAAFEAWVVSPDSWDREKLGPRPNEPGRRIPADIVAKGVDRSRKRKERRKEAEAAAAKRAAADAELRTKLLHACNQNYAPSLQVADLAPIREVLRVLPLDRLLVVIRQKVDKRCFPGNPPLVSWRDPKFLRAVAEDFCQAFAIPGLMREWGNAGRTPATKAQSSRPAGDMPDDADELRSHHDVEHEPAGPHTLPAAGDVSANAADASEAPAAVSVPPV